MAGADIVQVLRDARNVALPPNACSYAALDQDVFVGTRSGSIHLFTRKHDASGTYFALVQEFQRVCGDRQIIRELIAVPDWSALVARAASGIVVLHCASQTLRMQALLPDTHDAACMCVFPRTGLIVAGTGSMLRVFRLVPATVQAPHLPPRRGSTAGEPSRHSGSKTRSSKLPPQDVRRGNIVPVGCYDLHCPLLTLTACSAPGFWQPYLHSRHVSVPWGALEAHGIAVPPKTRAALDSSTAAREGGAAGGAAPGIGGGPAGVPLTVTEGLRLTALPDTEVAIIGTNQQYILVQPAEGVVVSRIPFAGMPAAPEPGPAPSPQLPAAPRPGRASDSASVDSSTASAPPMPPAPLGSAASSGEASVVPLTPPRATVLAAWPQPSLQEGSAAGEAVRWLAARHLTLPSALAAAVALVAAAVADSVFQRAAEASGQKDAKGLLGGFSLSAILIEGYFGPTGVRPRKREGAGRGGREEGDTATAWQGLAPDTARRLIAAAKAALRTMGVPAGSAVAPSAQPTTNVPVAVQTVPWEWEGAVALHMPSLRQTRSLGAAGEPGQGAGGGRLQHPHRGLMPPSSSAPGAGGSAEGKGRPSAAIIASFKGQRLGKGAALSAMVLDQPGGTASSSAAAADSNADMALSGPPRSTVSTSSTPLLLAIGAGGLEVHRLLPSTSTANSSLNPPPKVTIATSGEAATQRLGVPASRPSSRPPFTGHPLWPVSTPQVDDFAGLEPEPETASPSLLVEEGRMLRLVHPHEAAAASRPRPMPRPRRSHGGPRLNKPAHFFFAGTEPESMSDAASVSTTASSVRGPPRSPHARVRGGPPVPRQSPPRAGGSFGSEAEAPAPRRTQSLSQPHALPEPTPSSGNIRSRMVQRLPLQGAVAVLQCPREAAVRSALSHWEQRQLEARRLATRVLTHLRVATGVSAWHPSRPASPPPSELLAAFDAVERGLQEPLSYAQARRDLGLSKSDVVFAEQPERVLVVAGGTLVECAVTNPLSHVADLMTEHPPNFREALWICNTFIGTRLGMGLDIQQVRKWREQHGYRRFAAGAFGSALRHLWRSQHPLRRVLALVPQVLPRGVALRRILPHAMTCRLLMDDMVPKVLPHLVPYLRRWRSALRRRQRRQRLRLMAAAHRGGRVRQPAQGAVAGGTWKWLLGDGASGSPDVWEVEGVQGEEEPEDAEPGTPRDLAVELQDVTRWAVGDGAAGLRIPDSALHGLAVGMGGAAASGSLKGRVGQDVARAAMETHAHIASIAQGSTSNKALLSPTVPPGVVLGGDLPLTTLVDNCLLVALTWRWASLRCELEQSAKAAATMAVVRKMAPDQVGVLQARMRAAGVRRHQDTTAATTRANMLTLRGRGGMSSSGSAWEAASDARSIMSGSAAASAHVSGGSSALASSLAKAAGLPTHQRRPPQGSSASLSAFSDDDSDGGSAAPSVSASFSVVSGRSAHAKSTALSSSSSDASDGSDCSAFSEPSIRSWDSLDSLAFANAMQDEDNPVTPAGPAARLPPGAMDRSDALAGDVDAKAAGVGLPLFDVHMDPGADCLWASVDAEQLASDEELAASFAADALEAFLPAVTSRGLLAVAVSAESQATRAASSELSVPSLCKELRKCRNALFRLLAQDNAVVPAEATRQLSRTGQWRHLAAFHRSRGDQETATRVIFAVLARASLRVQRIKAQQQPVAGLGKLQPVPQGLAKHLEHHLGLKQQRSLRSTREDRHRVLCTLVACLAQTPSPHEPTVLGAVTPLLGGEIGLSGIQAGLSVFQRNHGEYTDWFKQHPGGPDGTEAPPTVRRSSVFRSSALSSTVGARPSEPTHPAHAPRGTCLNPFWVASFLLTGRVGGDIAAAARELGFAVQGSPAPWWCSVGIHTFREMCGSGGVARGTPYAWDGRLAAMSFLEHVVTQHTAPPIMHAALAWLYMECLRPALLSARPAEWASFMRARAPALASRNLTDDSDAQDVLSTLWQPPHAQEESQPLLRRLRLRLLHFLNTSTMYDASNILSQVQGMLRQVRQAVEDAWHAGGGELDTVHSLALACVEYGLVEERIVLTRALHRPDQAFHILLAEQRDIAGALRLADDTAVSAAQLDRRLPALTAEAPSPAAVYTALLEQLFAEPPLLAKVQGSDPLARYFKAAFTQWKATCKEAAVAALAGRVQFLDGVSVLDCIPPDTPVQAVRDILKAIVSHSSGSLSTCTMQVNALRHRSRLAARDLLSTRQRLVLLASRKLDEEPVDAQLTSPASSRSTASSSLRRRGGRHAP